MLAGVGLFVALVVGVVMFHVLLALVLVPLKIGLLVFKGLLLALFALPAAVLGAALFAGLLAVAGALGVGALILSAIF